MYIKWRDNVRKSGLPVDSTLKPSDHRLLSFPTFKKKKVPKSNHTARCNNLFVGNTEERNKSDNTKGEFPLWHNGINGLLGALGRRFDPQPGTVY